jgi:polyhydroxyalkanoate synthesis regulator phasin
MEIDGLSTATLDTCPEAILFHEMHKRIVFICSLLDSQEDFDISNNDMLILRKNALIIYICINLARFGIKKPVIIKNKKIESISNKAQQWYTKQLAYISKLNDDQSKEYEQDLKKWYQDHTVDLSKWENKNSNMTTSAVLSPKAT